MTHAMARPYARRKVILGVLISLMPSNGLRVWGYRQMGYAIPKGTRIGLMTVISCNSFAASDAVVIGRNNRFVGPFDVEIGQGTFIGRFNQFVCGPSAASPAKADMNYGRRLTVGAQVLVNDRHYFDVYGTVRIGDGTWVAGIESQFWTHGASAMDRDITIGSQCYLGSAIRMAPGTSIGNRCVLGIASVVVGKLAEDDSVIGGFPAKRLRAITPNDTRQFVFAMD